jgi:RNA polymerase sigma-70 factor (ECF subfamily)
LSVIPESPRSGTTSVSEPALRDLSPGPRSSKGGHGAASDPATLREPSFTRPGDERGATYAVLDRIESTADEPGVRDLVDGARAGDEFAFAELYIRFFDRVHRYLLIALKNPDDALEAAQQVFVKLLEALPGHEPLREPFRAWLFRVVRNHAIDQQRRSGVREESESDEEMSSRHGALLARTSAMVAGDGVGGIKALIAELPQAQQRVLVLRFVYEFTAPETAEALGTTPDAVRHTQMRALKALARRHPGLRPRAC